MSRKAPRFTLTTADLLAMTGLSRQRIAQLREGYRSGRRLKDGSMHYIDIAPVLEEDVDWTWVRGKVLYADHVPKIFAERGIGGK